MTAEALWHEFANTLRRRLVAKTGGDEALADDLLQEVFLRVHERLDTLDDPTRAGPWISRIANNLAIDHFRKKHAQPMVEADHADGDPHERMDQRIEETLGAWVRAQLDTLPAHEREAVVRADVEGGRQSDVARELGISNSGFKSRVQRGRAKLRGALDKCCEVELGSTGRVLDFQPREKNGCAKSGEGCGC